MNHRSSAAPCDLVRKGDFDAVRPLARFDARRGDGQVAAGDGFDPDAWSILIEEQRALIAQVAGVDPSRVRIKIGH
jgi:hypothetical protein